MGFKDLGYSYVANVYGESMAKSFDFDHDGSLSGGEFAAAIIGMKMTKDQVVGATGDGKYYDRVTGNDEDSDSESDDYDCDDCNDCNDCDDFDDCDECDDFGYESSDFDGGDFFGGDSFGGDF